MVFKKQVTKAVLNQKYSSKVTLASLIEERDKSRAPITGFLIACAIYTKYGVYFGHNHEEIGSDVFKHAEMDALDQILKKEEHPNILKVVMIGGGTIKKFKNYTPCCNCTESLLPYVERKCHVKLLPLINGSKGLRLEFKDILKSFQKLEHSKFDGIKINKLSKELHQKTNLNDKDLDFVSNLAILGIKLKFNLYITGSSSGRGGVSNLIMLKTKSSYNDIDLIIISRESEISNIEEMIKGLLKKCYSNFELEDRFVPKHKNKKGVVIRNLIYRIKNGSIIDLTFAINIDGAFRQLPYELGNWYHQIV